MPSGSLAPFPGSAAITQYWDPAIGELGDDFGLSPGTPITAPDLGPGIITAEESRGKSFWGRRIQETFLSGPFKGWSFDVGHLTQFGPPLGAFVEPGQLLGYSGGALSDPQSGNTAGPHIEPQLQDPRGRYHNPLSFLESLFGGRQPAVPTDSGVPGPAFLYGTGGGISTISQLENAYTSANPGVAKGALGQYLNIDPVGVATAPFRAATDWLSSQGHNLENFAVANVIALMVAALILLVIFGTGNSSSSAPKPKTRVVPV